MRLSPESVRIIKAEVAALFGEGARPWLFGSRVDDQAKGGDIDLLIELDTPMADRRHKALRLVARLQLRLGDQPIDVLVLDPKTPRKPVHNEALCSGVRL